MNHFFVFVLHCKSESTLAVDRQVPLDKIAAANYFQQAADMGDAEGQYSLGVLLEQKQIFFKISSKTAIPEYGRPPRALVLTKLVE